MKSQERGFFFPFNKSQKKPLKDPLRGKKGGFLKAYEKEEKNFFRGLPSSFWF